MRGACCIFSTGSTKLPKMDITSKLPALFYNKAGELFYAIAAIDNRVRKEEYISFKKSLDSYGNLFEAIENDKSLKPVDILGSAFKQAYQNKKDPETCFEDFVKYKRNNPELFTVARNKAIWNTANLIANSFSEVNKSEVILLQKLKMLLQGS
jgi:uncharacterized protein (DUF927 family)